MSNDWFHDPAHQTGAAKDIGGGAQHPIRPASGGLYPSPTSPSMPQQPWANSPAASKPSAFPVWAKIAAVVLAVLILLGAGAFGVHRYQQGKAIKYVLIEDHQAGQQAKTVADVVQEMEGIDLSDCPEDFSQAYQAHIEAWRASAQVEVDAIRWQEKYTSKSAIVQSFMDGLTLNLTAIANSMTEPEAERQRILAESTRVNGRIKSTFEIMKKKARKYGVSVPAQ